LTTATIRQRESPRKALVRHPQNWAYWRQRYLDHGIVTVPLSPLFPGGEKKPAVANYNKMGRRATGRLVDQPKFANAKAFGYRTGRMSGVTMMDVDVPSESVLADRMSKHGNAKLIIQSTVSGKYHVPYAYNGERRWIRPWKSGDAFDQVDILGEGGGIVVAAGSQFETGGSYQIIEGSLDDLDQLKPMRNIDELFWDQIGTPDGVYDSPEYEDYELAVLAPEWAPYGTRNRKLWEHSMRRALHCTSFKQLLSEAQSFYGSHCEQQPLIEENELVKIARSAWKYTTEERNWFGGQHGVAFTDAELEILLRPGHEYVLALLTRLKNTNGPHATFCLTDSWVKDLGWTIRDYEAARTYLVGTYIKQIRKPAPHRWALYRWINPQRQPV
jgi:hypothetical protein